MLELKLALGATCARLQVRAEGDLYTGEDAWPAGVRVGRTATVAAVR